MEIITKRFHELTVDELYEILKLRIDIFVVEQVCPYSDLDNLDQTAIHLYLKDKDEIIAYLRVLPPKAGESWLKIGRVISKYRKNGNARQLMKEGILAAKKYFQAEEIRIHAQCQAMPFYEKCGFVAYGEEFLEDDIPHKHMKLEVKE